VTDASVPHARRTQLLRVSAVVAGAAIVAFVGYGYYRHAHEAERVQQAADRLTVPDDWTYLGEVREHGSPFLCFVSCPHPAVTKRYRAPISPDEACAEIKARVTALFARPRRESWAGGCGWRAPLHSVGDGADIGASAGQTRDLDALARSHTVWLTNVEVYFSGGAT
jgi:hypothetical protein